MAFKHGRKAEAYLDKLDISTYLNSLDLTVSVAEAPATTFKATWDSFLSGIAHVQFQGHGYYDPTANVGSQAVLNTLQQAADSVLTIAPAGMQNIGDLTRLVMVDSTAFKDSSKIGGLVAFTWDVKSDGVVGFGYQLSPTSTISVTTTGATRDDLAQTTTGAIMHLHYSAITGGSSWVVKLQDSSDGSSWADVASGAFASISTASGGALRLVVPGTIRRYVRYIATLTGSGNLTFSLAIART